MIQTWLKWIISEGSWWSHTVSPPITFRKWVLALLLTPKVVLMKWQWSRSGLQQPQCFINSSKNDFCFLLKQTTELELSYPENSASSCCVFATSAFCMPFSCVHGHLPDVPRNGTTACKWNSSGLVRGTALSHFLSSTNSTLMLNQFIHGLKGNQKTSQESLLFKGFFFFYCFIIFFFRCSFCVSLLWCPCTDFTLVCFSCVMFSSSAWS